jgi:hypothetical protein
MLSHHIDLLVLAMLGHFVGDYICGRTSGWQRRSRNLATAVT